MKDGWSRDVILAALVISALVHVGLMFWAKPQIMTHVVSAGIRSVRRAPSQVTREAETPPQTDEVRVPDDVPAEKDSPEAEEIAAPLPALHAAAPDAAEAERPLQGEAAALPEILAMPRADAPRIETHEISSSPVEREAPSVTLAEMAVSKPESMAAPLAPPVTGGIAAEESEGPVFSSVGSVSAPKPPPPEKTPPPPEEPKVAFTPSEVVFDKVDEKVVEAEKSAVRELINVPTALDMADAAQLSMSTESDGDWTYFRVTVTPKARQPVVEKDFVVILDGSGSIGDTRLESCRTAARHVLRTAMNSGDRFNLVAFRNRFEYAFRQWQNCSGESFAEAEKWLSGLAAYGRTDIFSAISSVLTLPRNPSRPLVVLLVTDGDANLGVQGTREILSKFTSLNDGLVSVYAYGVRKSGNRELIGMLTRANRGESRIFEGTRKSQSGDDIVAFCERFRDPVMSDLRVVYSAACPVETGAPLLKNLCRGSSVSFAGRVPKNVKDIVFSLKGLSGGIAYEGYFVIPTSAGVPARGVAAEWREDRALEEGLHGR